MGGETMESEYRLEMQGYERVDCDMVLEIGEDGRVKVVTGDDPEGQQREQQ